MKDNIYRKYDIVGVFWNINYEKNSYGDLKKNVKNSFYTLNNQLNV